MKRMILTGIMAIGAGAMCLLAQAPPAAQAGAQGCAGAENPRAVERAHPTRTRGSSRK